MILSHQALGTDEQIRQIRPRSPGSATDRRYDPRVATIPGLSPIGATAFAAAVTDPGKFRSGCQFAAWLGLIPLQNWSGGKECLDRISRMGAKYLRRLLLIGATAGPPGLQ
jgi:transposase